VQGVGLGHGINKEGNKVLGWGHNVYEDHGTCVKFKALAGQIQVLDKNAI
jgi:hypothetical protein